MFDGTWQQRGHFSRHGVVSTISVDNVEVLDVEVLSSVCITCLRKEKSDTKSVEYDTWYANHQSVCVQNHKGSAPNMEPVGVLRMYERSRQSRKLEYASYVGDGDSKSFLCVQNKNVYGKPIEKKECVGHVQKRCGKRLRTLKTKMGSAKLSDNKTIGGRGRLTEGRIIDLQKYYGLAIRRNKQKLDDMKKDIWATLDHMTSTNDNPHHTRCPPGLDSWC